MTTKRNSRARFATRKNILLRKLATHLASGDGSPDDLPIHPRQTKVNPKSTTDHTNNTKPYSLKHKA